MEGEYTCWIRTINRTVIGLIPTGFPEEYEFGYQGNPELSGMVTPDMVPNRMKKGYRLLKGRGKHEVVIIWLQDFDKFIEAVNKYKQKYL